MVDLLNVEAILQLPLLHTIRNKVYRGNLTLYVSL
jgi:hypothetical protein